MEAQSRTAAWACGKPLATGIMVMQTPLFPLFFGSALRSFSPLVSRARGTRGHDQPVLRNLGHRATVGNHREDALYLCSVTLISLMGGECHASSEGP